MSALEKRTEQTTQLATVLTNEQLKFIANTEFVPKGLRGNLPAILACVATGRAIGIDDMTAIRSIHIIDGKPTFAAELMVMLVRRRGHSIVGEVGPDTATVTGKRADNGDEMKVTWTLEMAKRAGLTGKGNWKSYPEAMLWARAVSQLCRMLFADCFAGATHTPEELGDDSAGDTSGVAASTVAPPSDSGLAANEPASPADDREFPPVDENGEIIAPGSEPDPPKPTKAMLTKLNMLVAQLHEAEHLDKADLWRAHFLDPELGRGEDGEVHWSPLRDQLTREQASALIDRLADRAARVAEIEPQKQFSIPDGAK